MERIVSSVVKDYDLHYADRMEEAASALPEDHDPGSSAQFWPRIPKKYPKRRRRRKYSAGIDSGHDSPSSGRDEGGTSTPESGSSHDSSSSGRDEEAMSGWSSEGSASSRA